MRKTVTRQRRGCDSNPGPYAPESSCTLTARLPSHPINPGGATGNCPAQGRPTSGTRFCLSTGAVFGSIASVEVVCMVLGVVIFNTVYSKTLHIASGFVFLVMACFYAVSCVLLL